MLIPCIFALFDKKLPYTEFVPAVKMRFETFWSLQNHLVVSLELPEEFQKSSILTEVDSYISL